ncbi:MAG: SGNH/GDSL hydrolase family protein [Victivallales bacterium]|nr:SGNH/GDSL hydrolase family protein [Victivallales bacterium]
MPKRLLLLGIVMLTLSLFAGSLRDADLAKITEHFASRTAPWTWVFYGDSITHGAAHTHGWRSFPEIIQERVRTEMHRPMETFINSGNSGQTSLSLVNENQYNWQVRRHNPNVVLLLIGANDIVKPNCGGPEDFRQRLTELTRRIRQGGAIPVLQTYNTIQLVENPTTEYLRGYVKRYNEFPQYNAVIREVAAAEDTILVDHRKLWEEKTADPQELDRWLGETIHPGGYGHLQMAILILKELGMYSPKSKCCAVAAGGPSLPVAPLTPSEKLNWDFEYDASRDGLPTDAKWSVGYIPSRIAVRDGWLCLDNKGTDKEDSFQMLTLKDASFLKNAGPVVTVETVLRFPEEPPSGKSSFYLAFAAERNGRVVELILTIKPKEVKGSISTVQLPDKALGTEMLLRFDIDMDSANVTVSCDGKVLAVRPTRNLTQNGARLMLGDGGNVVVGLIDIRLLRISTGR